VPLEPVFDGSKPHTGYPAKECYNQQVVTGAGVVLFCDDFDSLAGLVSPGLAPQFQRNQSDYNFAKPWNTSYISVWNSGVQYPSAFNGDGYAVCVPTAVTTHYSSIITKPAPVAACRGASVTLNYQYVKQTVATGYLFVEYSYDNSDNKIEDEVKWVPLSGVTDNSVGTEWSQKEYVIPNPGVGEHSVRVRFTCSAGAATTNYCALDAVTITC
jgi:hypothetical protein